MVEVLIRYTTDMKTTKHVGFVMNGQEYHMAYVYVAKNIRIISVASRDDVGETVVYADDKEPERYFKQFRKQAIIGMELLRIFGDLHVGDRYVFDDDTLTLDSATEGYVWRFLNKDDPESNLTSILADFPRTPEDMRLKIAFRVGYRFGRQDLHDRSNRG